MRAVKGESAAHSRRGMKPEVSRLDESAFSVLSSRPYATSIESGDFDADIEWLVQLFVVSTRYVPRSAQRLFEPSDLPPALERVAVRAQRCLQTWFAWTDGPKIWFVVTETVPTRQRQDSALRLYFYDADGRFVCWGTWALQSQGNWILCER